MRGDDAICGSLFSYIDLGKRVRSDHPLRLIGEIVNAALQALSGEFDMLYSAIGRVSIPPERLMRALLLQAFYSIRSERQLVERIDYDLLFRWFCRARHRGPGVGCHDLHQEQRSAAGGRYGGPVSRRRAVARQGQRVVVE